MAGKSSPFSDDLRMEPPFDEKWLARWYENWTPEMLWRGIAEGQWALRRAEDLLRRLSEWDVLNLESAGGDDGPYWQREIAQVREDIRNSAETVCYGGWCDEKCNCIGVHPRPGQFGESE